MTTTRATLLLLLATGCDMVAEETLVDELRVISLRAEPPVLTAASGGRLDATIFDPEGRDVDVLLWTCAPGPLSCLEAGLEGAERPLSDWTTVARPVDEEVSHDVAPPPGLGFVPEDTELPPAFAWALACTPGTCPLVDEVRADPAPGSDAWTDVVARLAGMFDELAELPKVDTTAAFRTVPWRAGDPEVPESPTVTLVAPEGELVVGSGEELVLRLAVGSEGPAVVFPLASAGGFAEESVEVRDGEVEVTFVAGVPDEDGVGALAAGTVVRVWVVVEAEDGGSGVWKGSVGVE